LHPAAEKNILEIFVDETKIARTSCHGMKGKTRRRKKKSKGKLADGKSGKEKQKTGYPPRF